MFRPRTLLLAWLALVAITLGNTLLAEGAEPATWVVLLVCTGAALKGKLVVDHLMGLAGTERPVHWSLLAYFYLLAPLIALAVLFPETVRALTAL